MAVFDVSDFERNLSLPPVPGRLRAVARVGDGRY